MAEWPKAPDSKSGLPKGNVGSTPTLSSPQKLNRIRVSDGGLCPTALVAGGLKDPPRVLLENGEMPEWPKGHDWKSCVPQGTVGSTPTLSSTIMGTLGGFAAPSAPASHPTSPSLRSASPNPPALWLQRAKPAYANAIITKFLSPTLPRSGSSGRSLPTPTRS